MEKTEAVWEMLWKPQVKAPSGERSTSELSSAEREEPGERNSRAEMCGNRCSKFSRRRGVERVSMFGEALKLISHL